MAISQELRNYLSDPNLANHIPFPADDLNEQILTFYNILKWVIQDSCALIEVSPNQIVWKILEKDDAVVGQFDTPVNFAPVFQRVMNRDKLIGKSLIMGKSEGNINSYILS